MRQASVQCFLFNSRSLKNKLSELHCFLSNSPDCVFVCESWRNDTVTDTMPDPSGKYTVLRRDRAEQRTGGEVCALVLKQYTCRQLFLSTTCDDLRSDSGCDILYLEILLGHPKFRIILIYRPPNSCFKFHIVSSQAIALDKLLTLFVDPHLTDSTIILGDFNLPGINWFNSCTKIDGIPERIFNCMSFLGMHQIVTQPTRIASTGQSSILDLILTNDPLSINVGNYLSPFSTSDHLMIHFSIYHMQAQSVVFNDITPNVTHLPEYECRLR